MNALDDEFHSLFECNDVNVVTYLNRFIPLKYRGNKNMFTLIKLLCNLDDIKLGLKVAKFITICAIV